MQSINPASTPYHAIIDGACPSKGELKVRMKARDVFMELMHGMSGFMGSRFQMSVERVKVGGHRRSGYHQTDQDHLNIANAAKKRHLRRMKRAVYQHRCENYNLCLSTA